ncbi:hypothetical protein Efla_001737 [Eimeria flavescens]
MSGLAAASRSLAAILGLLGLATLALSLHAKGFTVGQQRQRSLAQWGPPPLPICSRQTQQSDPACGHPLCKKGSTWQSRGAPLRLFAEGGVGGEAGGPLLLVGEDAGCGVGPALQWAAGSSPLSFKRLGFVVFRLDLPLFPLPAFFVFVWEQQPGASASPGVLLPAARAPLVHADELLSGCCLQAERSVNRVTLMGRVGLDPEGNGEVRSRTEWHRVVVFDQGLVDLVEAFVHKGRRVYVEGALQTRRWVAADGQDRYTTEVLLSKYKGELVLLESPGDSSRHGARAAAAAEEGVAAAAGGVLPLTGGNGGPAATLGLRSPGGGVRLPGASGSFDST